MKISCRVPILCAGFLALGARGLAQWHAYYLDTAGNDAQAGTRVHPWKTLSILRSTHLGPGDSIFLRAGQVFDGTLYIGPGNNGSAAQPIWIGSYGKGMATIEGGDSAGMVLQTDAYLHVQRLRLKGSGRKKGNTKSGLALLHCRHVLAEDLDITGFQKSGLLIYASQNVVAQRIYVHENGAAGITVEGEMNKKSSRNLQILDCRAEDNPGDPTNLTNHSGNGIVAGHCTNLLIDRCSATDNGWDMPRIGNGPVGIWCYEADSVTIQHCLSYRNKTSPGAADGGGFDLDGGTTNSVIQYCLSYGNQGSGYCIFQYWGASPWYHNVIRYNITENDGTVSDSRAGVYIWNSSDDPNQFYDCLVYNNTVYCSKEAAVSYSEKSEHKQFGFYNNIFIGGDSLVKGTPGADDVFRGNDWWALHLKGAPKPPPGPTDLYQAPGFAGPAVGHTKDSTVAALRTYTRYRIPADSPLRDSGLDLRQALKIDPGRVDFNGQTPPPEGIGASF